LEWSGGWAVRFDRAPDGQLVIRGGIEGVDLALAPGASVPLAGALLGFYQGDLIAGGTALRRCLRARYLPPLDGRRPLPPVSYDHWFQFQLRFDEEVLRRQADAAAALGIEYFVVDAGWYAGCVAAEEGGLGFQAGVGNWTDVDPARFPRGIRPFADYVRSKGMRFGLWFEPERVASGSRLAREHPDWLIPWPADADRRLEFAPPMWNHPERYALLDFGRAAVREWVCALFDRLVPEWGLEWIRWDFNIQPRFHWEMADAPGRRGEHQLAHVAGLYAVLDHVRRAHPGLLIEGCASGGRRIDLGTLRRSHTY